MVLFELSISILWLVFGRFWVCFVVVSIRVLFLLVMM